MHTKWNRRQFVNFAAGSAAGIGFFQTVPGLFSQASLLNDNSGQGKVLVVVQLSGGNDGLNTVVPFADPLYYKNRFSLAIEKNSVRKIDKQLGFHPALSGFSSLLEQDQLAVIQGVGYPEPNRSHFESMDLWHTAHRSDDRFEQGWLGRFFNEQHSESAELAAIHFGAEKQPLALATPDLAFPSIDSLDQFRLNPRYFSASDRQQVQQWTEQRKTGQRKTGQAERASLLAHVAATADVAMKAGQRVEAVLQRQSTSAIFPSSGLGEKLKVISQMIAAQMPTSVYYVSLDGFDTHAVQGDTHAGLLTQWSEAVSAFMKEMNAQGNAERVLMLSFSEFGRRVRQNASQGTDHGTAGPVFMIGGGVNAGVHGEHPSLENLDDGDLKFSTDYRQVYATILEKWFAANSESVLGDKFPVLPVLK